jgi:hypothetical protein
MPEHRTTRRPRRTIGAVIVAVALAATVVLASIAPAHNVSFGNRVTLTKAEDYGGPAANLAVYQGRVVSAKPNCKRFREVQLWRVATPSDVRIKSLRTTHRGTYKVKGPRLAAGQKLYALIETHVIPSGAGHNHTCPVDRSPVRTYPYP